MSLNLFINLKNGIASLDDYAIDNSKLTDISGIFEQFGDDESETLTTSLDAWIDEEVKELLKNLDKVELNSASDLKNYLFDEADFLDRTLGELGLDHTENPEIRAYASYWFQHSVFTARFALSLLNR